MHPCSAQALALCAVLVQVLLVCYIMHIEQWSKPYSPCKPLQRGRLDKVFQ